MDIKIDDLSGPKVAELIREHLQSMVLNSPPESIHALDLESLRKPEITFWSAWEGDELVGCGALKELDGQHGEIKSMRTSLSHRKKGVAKRVLHHIIDEELPYRIAKKVSPSEFFIILLMRPDCAAIKD